MEIVFNATEERDNSIAYAIAKVRRTGQTNMLNYKDVLLLMEHFGDNLESEYLFKHPDKYFRYLELSGKVLQGKPIKFVDKQKSHKLSKELAELLDEYSKMYNYSFEDYRGKNFARFDLEDDEQELIVVSIKNIIDGYIEDIEHRRKETGETELFDKDLKIFLSYNK